MSGYRIYQPALLEKHVRALYRLKERTGLPMTYHRKDVVSDPMKHCGSFMTALKRAPAHLTWLCLPLITISPSSVGAELVLKNLLQEMPYWTLELTSTADGRDVYGARSTRTGNTRPAVQWVHLRRDESGSLKMQSDLWIDGLTLCRGC